MRAPLLRLLLVIVLAAAAAAPLGAQNLPRAGVPVLVIDIERVFSATIAGQRVTRELEEKLAALASENRRIEAELVAEERKLTELRPTMDPAEFRKLADEFDAKVQRIRAEQDAKEKALQEQRAAERQDFVDNIAPVLSDIARERGALVILERRTVLLSADAIDITEEAIARINALRAGQQDQAPDAPAPPIPPAER